MNPFNKYTFALPSVMMLFFDDLNWNRLAWDGAIITINTSGSSKIFFSIVQRVMSPLQNLHIKLWLYSISSWNNFWDKISFFASFIKRNFS